MTATHTVDGAPVVHTSDDEAVDHGAVVPLRPHSRFWVAVAVTVAAVLGFGVGWLVSDGDDSAGGSEFPTGRFAGQANATSVFEFDEDGTYKFCLSSTQCVSGVYGIRGDLYTEMTHDAVGFSMVPATYRWSFDGNELTFEVVGEDVLQPRNTTMSDRYVPLD